MSSIEDQSGFSYLEAEQMQSLQHHAPRNQKRQVFLVVTILLIVGGACVWILNIVGIIPGPWSGIFGPFFTVLGVVLALPPLFSKVPEEVSAQTTTSPVVTHDQSNRPAPLEGTISGKDEHGGTIIVYVKEFRLGSTVNLKRGFNSFGPEVAAASSVVERGKNSAIPFLPVFLAVFTGLEPGNYTVYTEWRITKVTVHAGQIIKIDWRHEA